MAASGDVVEALAAASACFGGSAFDTNAATTREGFNKSSCTFSSTFHIAARRCSAKQFKAPSSANVRTSSFVRGTLRLKSSNDPNCQSCLRLTKDEVRTLAELGALNC